MPDRSAVAHDLEHPRADSDPVWLSTPRLLLRRPRPADLDPYTRLHTDPRTYTHSPLGPPTAQVCVERLEADLTCWRDDGYGYAAVVERLDGAVVGWAGLRREQREDGAGQLVNLYYRLAHDRIGRGYGREICRALVAWGVEWLPEPPVTAVVDQVNAASIATATSAGLVRTGLWRHPKYPPDADPMMAFEAPSVRTVKPEEAPVDELLDLWVRVNDAGGAVGFVPGTPRLEVAQTLESHLAEVRAWRARLVAMHEPTGALLGFGFWLTPRHRRHEHVAELVRLMVEPTARGRNLGRLLLAGMVGVARRELNGIRLLRLDYRAGLGLGSFYEAAGWTEVGRVAEGLWLGGSEYRDDVAMARRVDGAPLVPDGGC
ncbi:MAG: GNAT family N-acetyltransferase [Humibacillus sp.]|nr:GNAT family N-acetyltransferase [Humibacillus sp.]MDN5779594.1 GNAT family N-acetyltransferase [Humibacillus sp.]